MQQDSHYVKLLKQIVKNHRRDYKIVHHDTGSIKRIDTVMLILKINDYCFKFDISGVSQT
jgi:hypothetical protein